MPSFVPMLPSFLAAVNNPAHLVAPWSCSQPSAGLQPSASGHPLVLLPTKRRFSTRTASPASTVTSRAASITTPSTGRQPTWRGASTVRPIEISPCARTPTGAPATHPTRPNPTGPDPIQPTATSARHLHLGVRRCLATASVRIAHCSGRYGCSRAKKLTAHSGAANGMVASAPQRTAVPD